MLKTIPLKLIFVVTFLFFYQIAPSQIEVTPFNTGGNYSKVNGLELNWISDVTNIAKLIYVVLAISLLVAFIKIRSDKLTIEKRIIEVAVGSRTKEIIQKNDQLEKQSLQLKEMDELKSRFFANISHEFRTPITLISGPVKDAIADNEEKISKENLIIINRNADRILRLVNQLLDLSKLDAGKLSLEPAEGDLYKFLRMVSSSFSSYLTRKEIGFNCNVPDRSLFAFFDHDKLEKIVYNLLSNAFKYSLDKGKINFYVTFENGHLLMEVLDTGKGIPKDELGSIFNRFYQGDRKTIIDHEGSGIGLSFTKELVELMKGEITVESIINKGAKFKVRIPIKVSKEEMGIVEDIPETTNEIEKPKSPIFNDCSKVILVVEDNDDMRDYISSILSCNYTVLEANNGKRGLEIAQQQIPDLIVTDLMMPIMDGLSLSEKIKENEKTSHIPIVMVTGRAEKEAKIEGFLNGVDQYLTKPFDKKELLVRVNNLLAKRKKLRTLYANHRGVHPKNKHISSLDEVFIGKLKEGIENNLSDPEFDVTKLLNILAMSRTQLHRKLKALTNQSTSEFIRNYRLKRAKQILSEKGENVSQVAFMVGFSDASYFSKCFNKSGKTLRGPKS